MQITLYQSVFLFLLLCQCVYAQELPRRAYFGIRMEAVTEDVRRVMNLQEVKGVLVQDVLPGSTAETAGLKTGDVVFEINSRPVNSPDAAVHAVTASKSGEKLKYKYIRDGKTISEEAIVHGFPCESFQGLATEYSQVTCGSGMLRTITTYPKNKSGRLPAVLFIQGIGCYSLDTPFDTLRPETQLVNDIARRGFVVMRVDKSGMGDSQGPPCNAIDFNTELEGYLSAFTSLQNKPNVDARNCFIFGHSMGGVMAPLIAREKNVKGIMVYGTIGVNFMEYFTHTRRNIAEAYRMSPAETDDYIKEQCACASMLLSAKLSREEAVQRNSACGAVYDFLLDRDSQFWYQLNDLNIPGIWQDYAGAVLSLRGDMDYITTRMEHELIVSIVNPQNPGKATFKELTGTDHAMQTASSYQQATSNPGPFNRRVSQTAVDWLKEQIGQSIITTQAATKEKVTQVVWSEGVENAYPHLSHDGKQILFQSNRSGKWHLYLMHSDGSNVRQITSGDHNNNFPDLSPDDQFVAFVSDRDGNEEVYMMDIDGRNIKRLTNHPARDIHPYFSYDGKALLFNSSRDQLNSFEIYHISTNGSGERRLTNTSEVETCARYSPDGKKILYLKGFADGSDDIFVMHADGSGDQNLTQTPQMEGWPSWSPDGTKVVFSSRRAGNYSLYEIDTDGSNVRRITYPESVYEDARAVYSASGDTIAFNRQRGGTIGIYLLEVQH